MTFCPVYKISNKEIASKSTRFLSVVVITCPSHGQGRRFDPGRNQADILIDIFSLVSRKKSLIN